MRQCLYLVGLLLLSACSNKTEQKEVFDAEAIHFANERLIKISMEDVYSPPVASRVFAYPNLAAYEVYQHRLGLSIINKIEPNTILQITTDTTQIDYSVASLTAYCKIAHLVVFSEYLVDSIEQNLNKKALSAGINKNRLEASKKYGEKIAEEIKKWISKDNYASVKAGDFYTQKSTDSSWVVTPPMFEQALEPNWKNLRPLTLPNLEDFKPKPRPAFSIKPGSEFFEAAKEVYEIGKKPSDEEKAIALHWDCNPNEYNNKGHNTFFIHKMSPPAHWMSIHAILSKQTKADFSKSLLGYALITSAMFDGIISCWHTKYTEELIRPETYINRYIDRKWQPFIQTPPFPEFTSGHSVVSGAASTILENLFPNTPFVDDTEVQFDLPARKFKSVLQAGEEASYSRFYGGIHYRFGIELGYEQGKKIGEHVNMAFNQ